MGVTLLKKVISHAANSIQGFEVGMFKLKPLHIGRYGAGRLGPGRNSIKTHKYACTLMTDYEIFWCTYS